MKAKLLIIVGMLLVLTSFVSADAGDEYGCFGGVGGMMSGTWGVGGMFFGWMRHCLALGVDIDARR